MSFTTEAVVGSNGTLNVCGPFPFAPGEAVEVTVRAKPTNHSPSNTTALPSPDDPTEGGKYPLRGKPGFYIDPFEPVLDWPECEA